MKNKLLIYILLISYINILFSSQSLSGATQLQTQKESIILLVHGQGKNKANFSDDAIKKEQMKKDLLMKYLIEDLKINPKRIYSMNFNDNLEEIQKKMVELGATGYKNPTVKDKDQEPV